MKRLTNMYYSQYDSEVESEPNYDSDNTETIHKLHSSPSQAEFRRYIERRNDEELLHEGWKQTIREDKDLPEEIERYCGMKVYLRDNLVKYVYRPVLDGNVLSEFKFKISLVYIKLLRKWYISLGRSVLPEVVRLHDKLKKGAYNPVCSKVLQIVSKTKTIIDVFMRRLIDTYRFIEDVQGMYKDIEFQVKPTLTSVKIMLKERGWPRDIERTSPKDIIILEMILNENLEVEDLNYEYIYSRKASVEQKRRCVTRLEQKLQVYFDLPLLEAFRMFMEEEDVFTRERSSEEL